MLLLLVNELANTMDLESTLIRAEALFRRFQRLVEAVDKKSNFPGPRTQANGDVTSSPAKGSNATSSSAGSKASAGRQRHEEASGQSRASKGKGKDAEILASQEEQARVITPELRKLLSRKVEVLPRANRAERRGSMAARCG